MELQDPTRNQMLSSYLKQSGVKAIHNASGLYFLPTLRVETETDVSTEKLTVTVRDHWNDEPVENSTIICAPCEPIEAQTDSSGRAVFVPSPTVSELMVQASHDEFNTQKTIISWP